ncbi:MAG: hypothetical protein M1836_003401 [Candelina mexicana]|nr:MAG: hypothetical protein M1836_003401 [Candelina mexicana]
MLWLYISRNFAKVMGLETPEPLANLYTRSYFRATWVTTALDAGFWTAMRIRRKWLRDLASMVFSIYYLVAAEQADEKVRKVRGMLTVDHLRVSWNKSTTPYLSLVTKLLRPRLARYPPRAIRIPRPSESSYTEPVTGWLYFDGPLSALRNHTKVVIDIPGGGFVAMTPRNNDDKLLAWAGKTGLPVLSLDYRKAPEYPYPYSLNECYDVYHTIVASNGRCIGLSGASRPRIIITGDSAGGNLATGVVLMVLQSASTDSRHWQNEETLPTPEGLVLIYPGLDFNIGNWMTDEQMSLIKDRRMRKTNINVLRQKSEDYNRLTPGTPHHSDDDEEPTSFTPQKPPNGSAITSQPLTTSPTSTAPNPSAAHLTQPTNLASHTATFATSKPAIMKTRLAMSSMISYFNDRILTPEMMRAMIILYVGPHNRPDFSTDFLLSPLLAPESLLARFPKTYFLTGERDPLVDDTVIFAGRIRQAKWNIWRERRELGLVGDKEEFEEKDIVEVLLIPGISHGFLQFVGVFPEGWRHIFRCARWMEEIFERDREQGATPSISASHPHHQYSQNDYFAQRGTHGRQRHHRRTKTESSGDEDRPLEMSISSSTGSRSTNGHALRRNSRRKGIRRGKESDEIERKKSMVSLASEDGLLGRRMKGLAGGLMGISQDTVETP